MVLSQEQNVLGVSRVTEYWGNCRNGDFGVIFPWGRGSVLSLCHNSVVGSINLEHCLQGSNWKQLYFFPMRIKYLISTRKENIQHFHNPYKILQKINACSLMLSLKSKREQPQTHLPAFEHPEWDRRILIGRY